MKSTSADLPLKASQRTWAAQAAAFALGRWSPLEVFTPMRGASPA